MRYLTIAMTLLVAACSSATGPEKSIDLRATEWFQDGLVHIEFYAVATPPTTLRWSLTEASDKVGPAYGQAQSGNLEVEVWWDADDAVSVLFEVSADGYATERFRLTRTKGEG